MVATKKLGKPVLVSREPQKIFGDSKLLGYEKRIHTAWVKNGSRTGRELGRLVGVKFWEVSPLRADSEDPPGHMLHNPLQSG
jgi:hypothetical protein